MEEKLRHPLDDFSNPGRLEGTELRPLEIAQQLDAKLSPGSRN